jgi:predicted HicB family RNase H-like nuclease
MARIGRPPKKPEERQDFLLSVRVTEREQEALDAVAAERGVSVSTLVRTALEMTIEDGYMILWKRKREERSSG